jgi:DNA-binding CsgD family transcriptional regulator
LNSGETIGFIISIRPYNMPSIPKIMENIFKVVRLPQVPIDEKKLLTKKQYFILYFYIRNYSSQKISEVLTVLGYKVTTNTINKHLGNIKKVLNVTKKTQLMDKALVICYHGVPDSLLKTGIFESQNTLIDKWVC